MQEVCQRQCLWRYLCERKYRKSGLNTTSYQNNYRQLFQDRNGWLPYRMSGASACTREAVDLDLQRSAKRRMAVVGGQWKTAHIAVDHEEEDKRERIEQSVWQEAENKKLRRQTLRRELPKFNTTKMELNPQHVNTMDIKQDDREIFIASAGVSSHNDKMSAIRILDSETYCVKKIHKIMTRSINCIDVSDNIIACGDDNGIVRVFGRDEDSQKSTLASFDSGHIVGTDTRSDVNDLRVFHNTKILAVRTRSRYPAGMQFIDLQADKLIDIPANRIQYNWLHAIDVDADDSSSSDVVAVGEKIASGYFTVLKLDFRTEKMTNKCFGLSACQAPMCS
eukprot:GHVQ01000252.1.p1 GENE.GHVQ01000252.1~~GHVQ01000252.1.p1  ORF type:complete len:336 (+),score=30.90 GHVQ01000252.1:3-1010(+)